MPTYEYRCKECGHTFDAYQAFSDDALTECPECGGALKKLFGNVGISFKGSGFYKTDSRTSGSGTKSGSTASSDSSATAKDSGGSGASSSSSDSSSSSGSDSGATKKSDTSGASKSTSSGSTSK